MDHFENILDNIENQLGNLYEFKPQARVCNHIISHKELSEVFGSSVQEQPEFNAKAAVWLKHDQDNFFIGIHFDEETMTTLKSACPLHKLSNENINSFVTVVEEVSHFHCILNRFSNNRNISKLELELQAEIDKLLLSAALLERQVGDPHFLPLARMIYNNSSVVAKEAAYRYDTATRQAAKIWYEILEISNPQNVRQAMNHLLPLYNKELELKFSHTALRAA